MIEEISEAFPHILNGCLQSINNRHSFVFEDKARNKGIFVSATDQYHLHIQNNSDRHYYFLQNDACVMNNERGGQCDYVILNDVSIVFTDIKVAAGNRANHRKEAYRQIANTFKFYSKAIEFKQEFNLHGLVCFPSKSRIIKPSTSTKRKEFKDNYNINLVEGNYILFD